MGYDDVVVVRTCPVNAAAEEQQKQPRGKHVFPNPSWLSILLVVNPFRHQSSADAWLIDAATH